MTMRDTLSSPGIFLPGPVENETEVGWVTERVFDYKGARNSSIPVTKDPE
ncbi:hypothetical protein GbCGDNIH2_7333 [Granulibacter bethesdensis]|uniref:Uncharacterized protein n=1 Tax=Granulibacter bethesdensis (strain ATCC BAA-1260 / CGDNIH1) TaxID=391165 RepID=A0A286M3A2_GRABC|nr:hypothetical protein GbCGDNIH2_7333 [Granulibacter bethesdensis]APH53200.1 hypothetical protein GbCGDNIH5_7333 [Granulibacter bethesdensis]APH65888.1 hypothetical protein GbCGDNIH1I4_7333 [Granulibacter bethesdensis]ASV62501.1 hypothetical protein GbCGDNIH1_7333 [Granulibacter bethesdensis CGDNIH1]